MMAEYTTTAVWLVIVVVGGATYLFRLSFLPLIGRLERVPPRLTGTLRFIPVTVFAALAVPSILSLSAAPTPHLVYEPAKLLAAALAVVVAWRTRNMFATIGIGMVVLWTVQLLL